jgi:apolipoprotein N-acyltransferase
LGTIKIKDYILAVLSGLLLISAFPKFNLEILAWVALIPWLWSIQKKSPLQAALLGFVCGFVFFTGLIYWVYNVLTQYGHIPSGISIFFLVVLTAYLALYFSAFSFLLCWIKEKSDLSEILFAPPLWVSLEYIRGFLLSGFPWEFLGYSQFLTLPVVQIAEFTGIYGVSFIIVLVNVSLYRFLVQAFEEGFKSSLKEVLAAGLIIILSVVYGQWRIHEVTANNQSEVSYQVALIQGNIPQDIKWEPRFQEETVKIYSDLTQQTKPKRPDFIIWPETATPFFFQNTYPFQYRIMEISHQMEAPLLFGSPAFEGPGPRIHYFNSAFLISPQKQILSRYDKIHLVPFGEYVPLAGVFGFTQDIIGAMGDFTPGEKVRPLSLPWGNFGVLICYEAIFPDLTRKFVKEGAQFLVNITNDGWFGKTSAPYQHLSMVAIRAIENRVSIARAANTGISAFIDSSGRITSSTDIFTRDVLSGKLSLGKIRTFYAQYGDIFSYACLGFTGFLLIFIRRKRGNRGQRNSRSDQSSRR